MTEVLEQLDAAVTAAVDAPVWPLSDAELTAFLDGVHVFEQRLAAVRLAAVREVDGRGLARREGASSTGVWLRDRLKVSGPSAARMVKLAASLDKLTVLQLACREGEVTVEQAQAIAGAVEQLPTEVGADIIVKAETALVGFAAQFEPLELRRLGQRVLSHVAPEVAERMERRLWERAEKQAYVGRSFALSQPDALGRVRAAGWFDVEAAAVINAALDPLCTPGRVPGGLRGHLGPYGPAQAGQSGEQPGSDNTSPSHAGGFGESGQTREPGDSPVVDERSPGQRRADALVELCQLALATTELPDNGGDRPQVGVTIDYDAVTGQLGTGMLDTGETITPEAARRMACDAHLLPAVLNGAGQVLDLGQTRRLVTGPLRRALVLRDRGCAFPACDRPARWSHGHHIRHWADGGPTSLDNTVLVCGHHHRLVHHSDWQVRIAADGLPEFLPPEYIDKQRTPRRNTYWKRL